MSLVRRTWGWARLISAYLKGPQDLTITDGATPEMRRIWTALGGELSHLACLTWTRVLRPWGFVGAQVRSRGQHGQPLSRLQLATTWAVARRPPPISPARDEPLTPAAVVELLPQVARGSRLHLAYDQSFTTWLLAEAGAVTTRGILTARTVRDHTGKGLGWFVYYLVPSGTAQVLQIAAAARDADAVVAHLLHHAHANGAVAVQGRVEANVLEAIGSRGAAVSFTAGARAGAGSPRGSSPGSCRLRLLHLGLA